MTAGRISEYLDIRPSGVQIINQLEHAGMAARVKSEDDARITFVRLTDKGEEKRRAGRLRHQALNEALFRASRNWDSLASFDGYLSRLQTSIDGEEFQHKLFDLFGDDARWRCFVVSSRFGRARAHMMRRSGFPDGDEAFRGGYGHRGGPRERGWR